MRHVHFALLAALLTSTVAATALAQGRGFRGGRGPGRGGHGPDKDFVVDRDDFHFLLEHHDEVRREVKELENGVETVTESDDKDVAARIQKHVAAMYQRVEHKRPIRMRDPLFAELFRHADNIKMEFENTPKGIRVVETSDDEYVAKLIKAHAKVVSGFAEYGFAEAHKTHSIPGKPGRGGGSMHSHEAMADMVFVEFDRFFIPALALTNQMKQVRAANALQRLSKAWDARFVAHFHQMFDDDSKWPLDVSRIAQAIALANTELRSGDTEKAHQSLEPVRDILMNARRRNELDYPLDSLSQFHATMEAIVKPAVKMNVGLLTDSQVNRFSELAKQANQEWERVEQTNFDLAKFGKNEKQQRQFPSLLRAERDAIDQLVETLAERDKESILKAATGLKPPFAKVYMFFGDFTVQAATAR